MDRGQERETGLENSWGVSLLAEPPSAVWRKFMLNQNLWKTGALVICDPPLRGRQDPCPPPLKWQAFPVKKRGPPGGNAHYPKYSGDWDKTSRMLKCCSILSLPQLFAKPLGLIQEPWERWPFV